MTSRLLAKSFALMAILLCLVACNDLSPPETQRVITGTATLAQPNSVLPTGSRLHILMEDISRADIAAQTLAELEQDAIAPYNFALTIDPAVIQPNRRYNLRAKIINAKGVLLWITDSAHPLPETDTPVALKLVQVASATPLSMDYQCQDKPLQVTIDGNTATLALDDKYLALEQVVSASGLHFTSKAADFWSKGEEAMLTMTGQLPLKCTREQ